MADEVPTQQQLAVTPPPSYRSVADQDFGISMLMEMQKTLGKLEASIETMKTDVADVKKKTSHFEKVLYAAGVVLAIFLFVGGWLVTTMKDFAMEAYKRSAPPAVTAPAAPPPAAPAPRPR